ncbi:MAG: hypothetical protein GHCLOJNM_03879 [bacterium]|nr:hypothetical protein [bacterium]
MRKIVWLLVLSLACCPTAALAATVPVSGGAGLQAAINGANPNDVVEITDSLNYNEDIFIDKALTLRGASGQRPTITPTNTSFRGQLGVLANLNSSSADGQGVYIEADGVTLQNLVIANPGVTAAMAFDLPAALTIVGDNVTIDNCEISASVSGAADDTAVFVGVGDLTAFTGSTITTAMSTNNLVIQNCDITNGRRGIYVPDIGAAMSDAATAGTGNPAGQTRLPAADAVIADTSITVARRAYQPIGAKDWTFDRCVLNVLATNNQDVIRAQGGSATFNECYIGSANNRSINCQASPAAGGVFMNLVFNRCIICGGGFVGAEHNLIDDADITFDHCIITSLANTTIGFLRRFHTGLNGISNGFGGPSPYSSVVGRPPAPTSVTFMMNNCDYYLASASPVPFRAAITYTDLGAPIQSGAVNNLILTNNIITSDVGVFEGTQQLFRAQLSGLPFCTIQAPPADRPYYAAGSTLLLDNNIFRSANADPGLRLVIADGYGYNTQSTPAMNIPTETLTCDFVFGEALIGPANDQANYGSNFLDRDPGYPSIGDCANPASWLPADFTLRVAGTNGGPIGSQLEPLPLPSSSVGEWMLYE